MGELALADVEPADVRELYSVLRDDGVSTSGVKGVRAALSAMFATAVEDRLLRSNPVQGVRITGDCEEEQAKALTRAELALALAALPASGFCSSSCLPTPDYVSPRPLGSPGQIWTSAHGRVCWSASRSTKASARSSSQSTPAATFHCPGGWPTGSGRDAGTHTGARPRPCSPPSRGRSSAGLTSPAGCSSLRWKAWDSAGSAFTRSGTRARRCFSREGRTSSRCRREERQAGAGVAGPRRPGVHAAGLRPPNGRGFGRRRLPRRRGDHLHPGPRGCACGRLTILWRNTETADPGTDARRGQASPIPRPAPPSCRPTPRPAVR
jgi:hypothetical protein